MRALPRYTHQFKADAVALLHRSNRSIAEVASDLGISHQSLRDWYNLSPMGKRKKRPAQVIAAEKTLERVTAAESPEQRIAWLERELAAIRKENDELKEDRAILKKAAAFFAKESE